MDSRLRALNRFGLGARRGERLAMRDPRAWLKDQLKGAAPVIAAPQGTAPADIAGALEAFRGADRQTPGERQRARQRMVQIAGAEMRASLTERVTTERPYVERLVAFWSNHLCVSVGAKAPLLALAGSYEREVIRAHVLGRFEDMVLASAKHPAMLVYLDNFQSIGPASPGARQAGRRGQTRGLNENYARELLELHTLGVNGGYAQKDVTELARLLTGWTVTGLIPQPRLARRGGNADAEPDGVEFVFRPVLHEPGDKTVVGVKYGEGVAEGERAIRTLCHHPSTAKFVAGKLATHFISDAPPAAAVDRLAKAFRDSGGDLRVVAEALVDLAEPWDESAQKFRAPQDWMVAVMRALGAREVNEPIVQVMRQLHHPLWAPAAPKGFGDSAQEWADPDSLMNRAELARTIARRFVADRADPRRLIDVVDVPANDALATMLADETIAADERIALAIAGPAFQWR